MNELQYVLQPDLESSVIGWERYQSDIDTLAKQVMKVFYPDIMVGIFQGGYIVMQSLADYFGDSRLAGMRIGFHPTADSCCAHLVYTDEGSGDIRASIHRKKILIVDEIIDSGKSMQNCVEQIAAFEPATVKTACLFQSRQAVHTADFSCGYFCSEINYILPWRIRRDSISLLCDLIKQDGSLSSLELSQLLLDRYGIERSENAIEEELNKQNNALFSKVSGRWEYHAVR